MQTTLYDASVPVFSHYLQQLAHMLAKAAIHAQEDGYAAEKLLTARLAPDMFNLAQQVGITAGFSLRACYPLAGQAIPSLPDTGSSFAGLQACLGQTLGLLQCLTREQMAHTPELPITTQAGQAQRQFNRHDYLLHYTLPNFFFHLGMVYAILRHQGVPLSKQDFDGHHAYAPGFSFVA